MNLAARFTLLLAAACTLASPAVAHKYKFRSLHSFCARQNCPDGGLPEAGLTRDPDTGTLYGVSSFAGAHGDGGTVFALVPDGTKWKFKTLYSFCAQSACADGDTPIGNLIVDMAGNLYGTTHDGGAHGVGAAFQLTQNGRKWKLKVLHDFCSEGGGTCTDGMTPYAGLAYAGAASGALYDGISTLYGTASGGGSGIQPQGVVYQLKPQGRKWKQRVLYDFCPQSGCADGASPQAALLVDGAGNLYGTTVAGGASAGVVFVVNGSGQSVLYTFCPSHDACPDGAGPRASVLRDGAARLFGTTYNGGTNGGGLGSGTVFALDGASQSTVYDFCAKTSCADGAFPQAGLIMDASGNIFGTTNQGGANSTTGGAVFQIKNGAEQVLHGFCAEADCADGKEPSGTLVMDAAGNLFGTTQEGGAHGLGTVYELEF